MNAGIVDVGKRAYSRDTRGRFAGGPGASVATRLSHVQGVVAAKLKDAKALTRHPAAAEHARPAVKYYTKALAALKLMSEKTGNARGFKIQAVEVRYNMKYAIRTHRKAKAWAKGLTPIPRGAPGSIL